jgi:PilZ domain-containing protein
MSHPAQRPIPLVHGAGADGKNKPVEREVTTLQNFPDSPSSLSRSSVERRSTPRYTFLALAKVAEAAGVMCIQGRLRDVNGKGCYVNTPSTFAASTALQVVISRGDETFTTSSKVVYVHDGIGMGLVFVDTAGDQMETLNSWLVRLASTEKL